MINNKIFTPHQLTKNVKLLQKVAIIDEGQVLVLKRSERSRSRPNAWDLPGGNLEWPQDIKSSVRDLHRTDAAREVQEETGLTISPQVFDQDHQVYMSSYFEADRQIFTIILGWKMDVIELTDFDKDKVKISQEHSGWHWLSLSKVALTDFGGERGWFIVDIIERSFAR